MSDKKYKNVTKSMEISTEGAALSLYALTFYTPFPKVRDQSSSTLYNYFRNVYRSSKKGSSLNSTIDRGCCVCCMEQVVQVAGCLIPISKRQFFDDANKFFKVQDSRFNRKSKKPKKSKNNSCSEVSNSSNVEKSSIVENESPVSSSCKEEEKDLFPGVSFGKKSVFTDTTTKPMGENFVKYRGSVYDLSSVDNRFNGVKQCGPLNVYSEKLEKSEVLHHQYLPKTIGSSSPCFTTFHSASQSGHFQSDTTSRAFPASPTLCSSGSSTLSLNSSNVRNAINVWVAILMNPAWKCSKCKYLFRGMVDIEMFKIAEMPDVDVKTVTSKIDAAYDALLKGDITAYNDLCSYSKTLSSKKYAVNNTKQAFDTAFNTETPVICVVAVDEHKLNRILSIFCVYPFTIKALDIITAIVSWKGLIPTRFFIETPGWQDIRPWLSPPKYLYSNGVIDFFEKKKAFIDRGRDEGLAKVIEKVNMSSFISMLGLIPDEFGFKHISCDENAKKKDTVVALQMADRTLNGCSWLQIKEGSQFGFVRPFDPWTCGCKCISSFGLELIEFFNTHGINPTQKLYLCSWENGTRIRIWEDAQYKKSMTCMYSTEHYSVTTSSKLEYRKSLSTILDKCLIQNKIPSLNALMCQTSDKCSTLLRSYYVNVEREQPLNQPCVLSIPHICNVILYTIYLSSRDFCTFDQVLGKGCRSVLVHHIISDPGIDPFVVYGVVVNTTAVAIMVNAFFGLYITPKFVKNVMVHWSCLFTSLSDDKNDTWVYIDLIYFLVYSRFFFVEKDDMHDILQNASVKSEHVATDVNDVLNNKQPHVGSVIQKINIEDAGVSSVELRNDSSTCFSQLDDAAGELCPTNSMEMFTNTGIFNVNFDPKKTIVYRIVSDALSGGSNANSSSETLFEEPVIESKNADETMSQEKESLDDNSALRLWKPHNIFWQFSWKLVKGDSKRHLITPLAFMGAMGLAPVQAQVWLKASEIFCKKIDNYGTKSQYETKSLLSHLSKVSKSMIANGLAGPFLNFPGVDVYMKTHCKSYPPSLTASFKIMSELL